MNAPPMVSVLVPCRNERAHIARCLESILANDYPAERLEILVIDGQSDDGTADVIRSYAASAPPIRLLSNERRVVPAALNLGIASAAGEIVIRMDAHNEYPSTYISDLVGWLNRTGADNVGGAWITRPADDSTTARAIATAVTHRLGTGGAQYRLGAVSTPQHVDTVPFGCFRKELFNRVGLFDEQLIRNQDDEFNGRLRRAGGTVLLVPGVVSYYYARGSYRSLARTYYQYGFFKPLAAYKVGRVQTVRQLIPAALVAAFVVTGILGWWIAAAAWSFLLLLLAYTCLVMNVSLRLGRSQGLRFVVALAATFPVLHFSYGIGWIFGALWLACRRGDGALHPLAVPLSR